MACQRDRNFAPVQKNGMTHGNQYIIGDCLVLRPHTLLHYLPDCCLKVVIPSRSIECEGLCEAAPQIFAQNLFVEDYLSADSINTHDCRTPRQHTFVSKFCPQACEGWRSPLQAFQSQKTTEVMPNMKVAWLEKRTPGRCFLSTPVLRHRIESNFKQMMSRLASLDRCFDLSSLALSAH